MSSASSSPTAPTRRSRGAALVAPVAAALVACSGAAGRVALPARPATTTPAVASTSVLPTAGQQVVAALTGYTAALSEADKSRNPVEARTLLRPYLAADQIDGTVLTMSNIWAKGEVFIGEDVLHVLSVTVNGTTAFVHDCDDTSAMRLTVAETGAVVPGSAGIPDLNLVTRLDLVTGHWIVQSQIIEDVPCAA